MAPGDQIRRNMNGSRPTDRQMENRRNLIEQTDEDEFIPLDELT